MTIHIKMSQIKNIQFVGPNNIPVHRAIIDRIWKLAALGFDVSTLGKLMAIAYLMKYSQPYFFDEVKSWTEDDYKQIYSSQMSNKPAGPLGSPPPEDEIPADFNEAGMPDNYTVEQIEQMRNRRVSMRRIAQVADVDQQYYLLYLLGDAGFDLNDRMSIMQALDLLSKSNAQMSPLAATTLATLSKIDDKAYKSFMSGEPTAITAPVPSVVPPARETKPATPEVRPAGPVEIPPPPDIGDITINEHGEKLDKANQRAEMRDKYTQLIDHAAMQSGTEAANLLPIGTSTNMFAWLPGKGKPGPAPNSQHLIKAGDFLRSFAPNLEEPFGMVVGTQGSQLVVATFPSMIIRSGAEWDPTTTRIELDGTRIPKKSQLGQAQDSNGKPIVPGDYIQDPSNPTQQPDPVLNVMNNGAVVYQDNLGQKMVKNPGEQMEVIKNDQQQTGVGGPVMK